MADQTATEIQTVTLVAATHQSIELTGPGKVVELVHHATTDDVVYFQAFETDPNNVITSAGDNVQVLLPGERLTVNAPRRRGSSVFVELLSAGANVVTVALLLAGR